MGGHKSSFSTSTDLRGQFQFKKDIVGSELAAKYATPRERKQLSMPPVKVKKELKTARSPKKKKLTKMNLNEADDFDTNMQSRPESPLTPAVLRGNKGFDDYLGKKMLVWH